MIGLQALGVVACPPSKIELRGAMASIFRLSRCGFVCLLSIGLSAPVLAQPAPTTPRPYLAKDVQQAIDFLGTWARVNSGQDYFKDATFVGSQSCGGAG